MFFNPSCVLTILCKSFFISSHSYSKYTQLIIFNTIIFQPCVYIPINQLGKSMISLGDFDSCWITDITLNKYQNKCKYQNKTTNPSYLTCPCMLVCVCVCWYARLTYAPISDIPTLISYTPNQSLYLFFPCTTCLISCTPNQSPRLQVHAYA